jgi:hypothetical protein
MPINWISSRPLQRDNRITAVPREATNASKRGSLRSLKLVPPMWDLDRQGLATDLSGPRIFFELNDYIFSAGSNFPSR